MTTKKRATSALSTSSNELIDSQLSELLNANESSGKETTRTNGTKEVSHDEGEESLDEGENVAVMVRCRPLLVGEGANSRVGEPDMSRQQLHVHDEEVVEADETTSSVRLDGRQFFFDQVFGTDCDNERLYMRSARRLVDCAFRGYNCAIFLYGQTGTGKTYTHSSLTLAAFEHLMGLIQDSNKGMRFLIRASYYELYNEEIRDLLVPKSASSGSGGGGGSKAASRKPLELRESKERGVYVKDLTCFLVNNLAELKKLKHLGDKRRTIASTRMNEHSSRSHSIFSITIETISSESAKDEAGAQGETQLEAKQTIGSRNAKSSRRQSIPSRAPVVRVGHLNLIDLAGSERQSKSGASGVALKEASRINLSLTCLSLVIRALTDKTGSTTSGHIPYRNSKLTRLLSSSLGGNSKTILIACVSVARKNLDETLCTLRFASRTKLIKNKALINEDPKDALLRKYRKQLEELRMRLSEQQKHQQHHQQQQQQKQTDSNVAVDSDSAGHLNEVGTERERSPSEANNDKQLELLKAKIMFGGENLLDKLELHERLLEASRMELEERRREEVELRERLKSKKQSIEQVVLSKGSLETQLEYLDSKLNQAIELYRRSKLELADLGSEHGQLKEQLLQTIRSTSREIKYVDCIIDDFIPREQLDLINAYARYDDDSDEWQIKYIALSGNNMAQTRRLVGSASKFSAGNEAPDGQTVRRDRKLSAGMASARRKRGPDAPTFTAGNWSDPFIRLQ